MLEAVTSSSLLSFVNWGRFWKENFLQIEYSRWGKAHFVPNRSIYLRWRNTWMSQRKPSVLEAGASSTLFPGEIWVIFWSEIFVQIRFFKVVVRLFAPNTPVHLTWRRTCISPKNVCVLETAQCSTLFTWESWVSFTGILAATWEIHGGHRLCFLQIGLFHWVEETHVSLQRNPSLF
jgi:hypothetical protein